MGLGVTTRVLFATFPVLIAWLLLYSTSSDGLLVLGTYGTARSLAVLATALPAILDANAWQVDAWIEEYITYYHARTS